MSIYPMRTGDTGDPEEKPTDARARFSSSCNAYVPTTHETTQQSVPSPHPSLQQATLLPTWAALGEHALLTGAPLQAQPSLLRPIPPAQFPLHTADGSPSPGSTARVWPQYTGTTRVVSGTGAMATFVALTCIVP